MCQKSLDDSLLSADAKEQLQEGSSTTIAADSLNDSGSTASSSDDGRVAVRSVPVAVGAAADGVLADFDEYVSWGLSARNIAAKKKGPAAGGGDAPKRGRPQKSQQDDRMDLVEVDAQQPQLADEECLPLLDTCSSIGAESIFSPDDDKPTKKSHKKKATSLGGGDSSSSFEAALLLRSTSDCSGGGSLDEQGARQTRPSNRSNSVEYFPKTSLAGAEEGEPKPRKAATSQPKSLSEHCEVVVQSSDHKLLLGSLAYLIRRFSGNPSVNTMVDSGVPEALVRLMRSVPPSNSNNIVS